MPLEPSTARAAAWLSRAAAAGHADAQVALGNLLMRGVADVGPGADAAAGSWIVWWQVGHLKRGPGGISIVLQRGQMQRTPLSVAAAAGPDAAAVGW